MDRQIKVFHVWNILSITIPELIQIIEEHKNYKLIFLGPEEHTIFTEQIYKKLTMSPDSIAVEAALLENNVTIDYISGSYQKYTNLSIKNFNIIYWPTFVMHYARFHFNKNCVQPITNIESLFVSLNYRSRPCRRYLIDQIYKNKLEDDGNISWHNANIEDGPGFEYFHGNNMTLSEGTTIDPVDFYQTLPDEYFTSLINVISESTVIRTDISEKTWIPIMAKKPFISLAAKHYYKQLKLLGFELYTELFNYSFDEYTEYRDRANSIVDQLVYLKEKNIDFDETYQRLVPKIRHNYNNFYKLTNDKTLIPQEFFDYKTLIYKNYSGEYNYIYKKFDGK